VSIIPAETARKTLNVVGAKLNERLGVITSTFLLLKGANLLEVARFLEIDNIKKLNLDVFAKKNENS
jgi:hypothetical protein